MTEPLQVVEADAKTPAEGAAVDLVTDEATVTVTVPPPGRWKARANSDLQRGDFDGWASVVLSEDDYEAWTDADPTNDDVEAFFKAWKDVSGESRGKSRRSSTSSGSTRKR